MILKNPSIEIKKWLYSRLVAYSYLDVYDGMVPEITANEYIVINSRTASQSEAKAMYQFEVTANIEVCVKSDNFGYKRAEQIAELIMGGINSDTDVILPAGWDCKNVVLESVNNLEDLDPFNNTFRVILRYSFIITQTV